MFDTLKKRINQAKTNKSLLIKTRSVHADLACYFIITGNVALAVPKL